MALTAKNENINIVYLQPLDVACYGLEKKVTGMHKILTYLYRELCQKTVPKLSFPSLLRIMAKKGFASRSQNFISGFQKMRLIFES